MLLVPVFPCSFWYFGAKDDAINDIIIVLWWRSLKCFLAEHMRFWPGLCHLLKTSQKVYNDLSQKSGINIEK
jgi:hypothetical protein